MNELAATNPTPRAALGKAAQGAVLALGVLLPVVTLAVELGTNMCAEMLFDPLPTPLHVALVALVPASYLWLFCGLRGLLSGLRAATSLAGVACGIAAYYALIFLPLTPIAVIMVSAYGLGLLPLAPLLAVVAGWLLARWLRRGGHASAAFVRAAVAGAVLMLCAELPAAAQTLLLSQVGDGGASRAQAVKLLRGLGGHEQLLTACYRRDSSTMGIVNYALRQILRPVSTDDARKAYYLVTGRPFETEPRPLLRSLTESRTAAIDRVVGLGLESSQLEASVDSAAAVGYLEWTLVFHNRSEFQRAEATADVTLPSGGVVSRATLWVQGEPREAAFAGAGQARAAYESVVSRRRDPLLVTQPAPGIARIRCFPVEPGKQMKIRLGISFPLVPLDSSRARFALPAFAVHNFAVAPGFAHAVSVESTAPSESSHKALGPASEAGARVLRGRLTPDVLRAIHVQTEWRGGAPHWAADSFVDAVNGPAPEASAQAFVTQTSLKRPARTVAHWVIVVDGSLSLAPYAARLAEVLAREVPGAPITLIRSTLAEPAIERVTLQGSQRGSQLSAMLARDHFIGGTDNEAALNRGFEEARRLGVQTVVWLHGPQIELDPMFRLFAIPAFDAVSALVPIAMAPGSNPILDSLQNDPVIQPVNGGNDGLGALAHYLAAHRPGATEWFFERTRGAERPTLGAAHKTSLHLVRLWAAAQADQRCTHAEPGPCVEIAARYQLVTAVSGAVVLENAEQYRAAGLTAVPSASVPTIPEPETWLLLCVVLGTLVFASRARIAPRAAIARMRALRAALSREPGR